jgi:HlyD family secretion protein
MPQKNNEISLRSEEVNDVLSATPAWLLRWGATLIFALILGMFVLAYFIRYPDILTAEITLTTQNPPVTLVAKTDGKLAQLLVKNNEKVTRNQVIAIIENTANCTDIFYLDSMIKQLETIVKSTIFTDFPPIKNNLQTGEITPIYWALLKSLADLNLYLETNSYLRQIALLKKDWETHDLLLEKYQKQTEIHREQLALAEKDFKRHQTLFDEHIISILEYENKKREYLGMLSENEQLKIAENGVFIQITGIEKAILQLQIQDAQEREKLQMTALQNIQSTASEIEKWKQQYVISSPIAGKISFFSVWFENQNIQTGEALFYIVPKEKERYIGKCILPAANTGKLAVGQSVNIKLDNYPFAENGMLAGKVSAISDVPNKGNYSIDVALENGLTTTYGKPLSYKEEMKGQAAIITQNVSVLDRMIFNFRKLMERE